MDGVVTGTITLPESRLTVGPNAHVVADVEAQEVVVFGSLEGNLRASGRIELRQSAVVKGDIVAAKLAIEENACVKGRVTMREAVAETSPARLPRMENPATDKATLSLT